MQLDELREKLKQELQTTVEKFQESDLYNKVRERYLGLNSQSQNLVKYGAMGAIALLILSTPISQFFEANTTLKRAEELKLLKIDLVKVEREKLGLPSFQGLEDLQAVRSQIDQRLQGLRLVPTQIRALATKPPEAFPSETPFARNQILGGVEVSLGQLNIRQAVEIGQSLEQISNLILFKDLVMTPHTQAGYFDVLYQFLVLRPPAAAAINPAPNPAAERPPPGSRRDNRNAPAAGQNRGSNPANRNNTGGANR